MLFSAVAAPRSTRRPGLPAPVARLLRQLRRSLKAVRAFKGLATTATLVALLALGTFVLDRALNLPRPFRAVVLVLAAGAILYTLVRHFLGPILRRLPDDELALLIERAYPSLEDRLITAVQLAKASPERRSLHSAELVDAVIADTEGVVDRLSPRQVTVRESPALPAAVAVAAAAALLLLFGVVDPSGGRIWFERNVLLRATPWPRDVELEVRYPRVIAPGEEALIVAEVLKGRPSKIFVELAGARRGGDEGKRYTMAPRDEQGLRHEVSIGQRPDTFEFRVSAGDYESDWYTVRVQQRPTIESVRLWLDFPSYTGEPDTPADRPEESGSARCPAGTLVRYEARSTLPLKDAGIEVEKPGAVESVDPARIEGGPGGRVVRGVVRAKEPTKVFFHLLSQEDVESGQPAGFTLRTIPDHLPGAKVLKPAVGKEVTKVAIVPVTVELTDDYGVTRFDLVGGVRPKGRVEIERLVIRGERLPAPARKHVREDSDDRPFRFDLEALGLDVGDQVILWVDANDLRDAETQPTDEERALGRVTGDPRGSSRDRVALTVVSEDDLLRILDGRLKKVREDLQQVAREQRALIDGLEALKATLIDARALDVPEKRRLTETAISERRAGQGLERAQKEFAAVADETKLNRILPEDLRRERIRWLAELEAVASDLAAVDLPEIATALQGLRQATAVSSEDLDAVVRRQQGVLAAIQEIIRRLDKWDEYNEVLRDVRDVIREIERLEAEIRERARRDLDKPR